MNKQKPQALEGLLKTYSVKCRGIDKNNFPVLNDEQKEHIIVKVYRNGKSEPLCRYITGDDEDHCSAPRYKGNKGFCPYKSFA